MRGGVSIGSVATRLPLMHQPVPCYGSRVPVLPACRGY